MQNLTIEATKRTPAIHFDFEKHQLSLAGESYPEDVNQFHGQVISALESYLAKTNNQAIQINFDLLYFNSSSAKALIRIFDMLDETAAHNKVSIHWMHEIDDDNIAELGEEFGEDLTNAHFQLVIKSSPEVSERVNE